MNKLLLAASALCLGLTFNGSAAAHEPSHSHSRGHVVVVGSSYHLDHGVRFSSGYYYRGHDHHHWEFRVWDSHYCRYQYYDPCVRCYYYWDAGRDCYYPVGY